MNTAALDASTGATATSFGPGWGSLLWFLLIIAAIPVLLWLLKRTPMGGAGLPGGAARSVGQLALSAQHKVVTVEVGQGEDRRWLVLGVTPQHITTLHSMPPQGDAATADAMAGATGQNGAAASPAGFAALLGALRPPKKP